METPRRTAAGVACLLVSDLPLAAVLRAQPELAGLPLVVAAGSGPRAEVLAASAEATRAGVRPLLSVVHARALCPGLRVRAASPALERGARETLLDVARSLSPRAAEVPRGSGVYAAEAAVHLDASGVDALFHSEQGFATALIARARSVGLSAVAAIARSRAVSLLAARSLLRAADGHEPARSLLRTNVDDTLVLSPDAEIAFLDPLPLDLLDPDDALAETLTRFGIRCVGQLRRLPRRALVTRLGPGALSLLALAHGEADAVPLPSTPETRVQEEIDLEWAIERWEPLAFVLRGLLARLAERLELRGLVSSDLDLELLLSGGGRDARRIGVATPNGDPRALLGLLRLALEQLPPAAPIEGVVLATEGRPVRTDQLDLFRPAGPTPSALGRTLGELEALCGSDRVGAPRVVDDPHPDAFAQTAFAPADLRSSAARDARDASHGVVLAALRALRPPVSAEVRAPRGRPEWLRSAVANGSVLGLAGPWRTTGSWWSPERRFAFDSFDVQTEDGSVVRLRFDLLRRTWHVDAIYD